MKVLAITGTSGGHIFPALAFLDSIKKSDPTGNTLLVLPKDIQARNLERFGYQINYINAVTLKPNFSLRNVLSGIEFLKCWLRSFSILTNFKPEVVVGFGTLNSVPLIILAWLFRIKTIIHEQNVLPGRANRLLAKFVDRIAISFEQSRKYFKTSLRKVIFTGSPLRKELELIDKDTALRFFNFNRDQITILVMGGSQGSHSINSAFMNALNILARSFRLQVIHLSGSKDYDCLINLYRKTNVDYRLFSFFEKMQYAYSAADLLISRSGATTISEVILYQIPAILIPYPYAYKHQLSNARILEDVGAAVIIQDDLLASGILAKNLDSLLTQKNKLQEMHLAYRNLEALKSNGLLAQEALSINKC
jgi:UDP-N-acetylglucosamine--N-acetylmuramyl-(pentapeptide) pyrophosphoryl-undecaprenol N-acetylglucosamine transferase